MFVEENIAGTKRGWIEVICGSMFSGKTEELIRRIKRAQFAKQKVEIFKPSIDNRYHELKVVSHQGSEVHSTPVPSSSNILLLTATETEVVAIDEVQFFDDELPNVCKALADRGVRVIAAGLDLDFQGNPFGPMPQLLASAEYVTKVHAICLNCGALAYVSHRTVPNEKLVMLGETESYTPLCRQCFNKAKN